jgi:diaminohydroxyphosphoribosylaminopyrimidine deaminase / 5-amino-6-(5-phosphoribosylamino)uracil reductase
MERCLQLARLGAGNTAPNPLVGAVLVFEDRIIGEGFHQKYGEAHAEVNCLKSVSASDIKLISSATLYVSLEPCSHYGKTPPCADLIIQMKIPHVVIGCSDSFKKVNGTGIEKLIAAGIKVEVGFSERECRELNKRFFTFHEKKRPYIILKWAQTINGFIAEENFKAVKISNDFTNRLVHKLRTEEAAILVGKNTALHDDPALTVRLWKGNNPIRILLDNNLTVSKASKIFSDESKTLIINKTINKTEGNNVYVKSSGNLKEITEILYRENVLSVIVEGGTKTLQSFIDACLWDEAMVITATDRFLPKGIKAPVILNADIRQQQNIFTDQIIFYAPKKVLKSNDPLPYH